MFPGSPAHCVFNGFLVVKWHWLSVTGFRADWIFVAGLLDCRCLAPGTGPGSVILWTELHIIGLCIADSAARPDWKYHFPLEWILLWLSLFAWNLQRMILYPIFLATAQLKKPDCTVVPLTLLTLPHTFCVIQITAPMQTQITRAIYCGKLFTQQNFGVIILKFSLCFHYIKFFLSIFSSA